MYQKKQPIKTQEEWDAITYKNNVGIQIGACINKAVDIVIGMGIKGAKPESIESDIAGWTDILFKIGTDKKKKETTPKPVSREKATQAGIDFNKRILADSKGEDIEQETYGEHLESIKREEEGQKYGADNNGKQ